MQRVFSINDITYGTREQGFKARYHGDLRESDSGKAYDQLAEDLLTSGMDAIIPGGIRDPDHPDRIRCTPLPKPSRIWINILLFVITVFSVLFAGMMYVSGDQIPTTVRRDPGSFAGWWHSLHDQPACHPRNA